MSLLKTLQEAKDKGRSASSVVDYKAQADCHDACAEEHSKKSQSYRTARDEAKKAVPDGDYSQHQHKEQFHSTRAMHHRNVASAFRELIGHHGHNPWEISTGK